MQGPIIVVVEHTRAEIHPATYELVTLAAKLQSVVKARVEAVFLGDGVQGSARRFSQQCGLPVSVVESPRLEDYNAELYTAVLAEVLSGKGPSYVCVAHSSQGADFAPGVALRLRAACISGVEGFQAQDDGIRFFRSLYGGKVQAAVRPAAATTVLTLQPGSFRPHDAGEQRQPVVDILGVDVPVPRWGTLTTRTAVAAGSDLSEAKVLVAAGRGIGEEEHLELIEQLAGCFPQSAVCGSRPVIDAGWMPYSRQVGVTGATVSPDLYIACGISGALQHLSGMRGAGFVVSINTDPGAAIFNASDICIVEDLRAFIPQFIELAGR